MCVCVCRTKHSRTRSSRFHAKIAILRQTDGTDFTSFSWNLCIASTRHKSDSLIFTRRYAIGYLFCCAHISMRLARWKYLNFHVTAIYVWNEWMEVKNKIVKKKEPQPVYCSPLQYRKHFVSSPRWFIVIYVHEKWLNGITHGMDTWTRTNNEYGTHATCAYTNSTPNVPDKHRPRGRTQLIWCDGQFKHSPTNLVCHHFHAVSV